MEDWTQPIADFILERQLNIAVAALVTLGYFVYQYRELICTKLQPLQRVDSRHAVRSPRSRSPSGPRSHSRSKSEECTDKRVPDGRRRGRKTRRGRCPDCGDDCY